MKHRVYLRFGDLYPALDRAGWGLARKTVYNQLSSGQIKWIRRVDSHPLGRQLLVDALEGVQYFLEIGRPGLASALADFANKKYPAFRVDINSPSLEEVG